ncbi:hypothetical protein JW848_06630 [Candidatus Bipolaricaulota bacterium]|nr:hypothetical protein [Candidatus Bipolaricaulota bacterium]
MEWTTERFAQTIKTGVLGTGVTEATVREAIARVKAFPISAYAVDMPFLPLAKELFAATGVLITAAVGYPLGGMTLATKLDQIQFALDQDFDEINPSLNFCAIKSGDEEEIKRELAAMKDLVAGELDIIVIPQYHILTNVEKLWVTELVLASGIRGIKTNGHGGVCLPEDITLIKREFGDDVTLEASGGIRRLDDAIHLLELGASFIHSTSGCDIIIELDGRS